MGDRGNASFGYADFGHWYDDYSAETLEPALAWAMDAIQHELDDALSDRDLARIRSLSGRVKSKRRTWRKVNQPNYRAQIATVDDIPKVIDDLIGMRLTCTNLRDLEMVQGALEGLPRRASKKRPLGLDPTSERDYVESPKASGYRGWHVNLDVQAPMPSPNGGHGASITCELQIRTLLQDSWGELTHEDTYSKAGELPPLVEVLSARMADLLATLDDIAEDLRNELDRIDEAIIADGVTADGTSSDGVTTDGVSTSVPISGPVADAADIIIERWRTIDRPLELSSLAWALQHEFGAEVSDDWFGYRTFKRFLLAVIPDGEITSGRQAYLLPIGAEPDTPADPVESADPVDPVAPALTHEATADAADAVPGSVPDEARQLRRIDRGFPLVDTEQWRSIYGHLADAWRHLGAGPPSNQMVNRLTRSARDRAHAKGDTVSRRHLDHVAKAVLTARDSGEPLTADHIADAFATSVLQRMADLRIVPIGNAAARANVARWLVGG